MMQILPPSLFHFMCRTTHLDRLLTISSYHTPDSRNSARSNNLQCKPHVKCNWWHHVGVKSTQHSKMCWTTYWSEFRSALFPKQAELFWLVFVTDGHSSYLHSILLSAVRLCHLAQLWQRDRASSTILKGWVSLRLNCRYKGYVLHQYLWTVR